MKASIEFEEMPSLEDLYETARINPEVVIRGGALPKEIKMVSNDDTTTSGQVRVVLNCAEGGPRWADRMAEAAKSLGYYVFNDFYFKNVGGRLEKIDNFLVYSKPPNLSVLRDKSKRYKEENGFLTSFWQGFGQIPIRGEGDTRRRTDLKILDAYLRIANAEYRENFGGLPAEKYREKPLLRRMYERLIKIF